MSRSSTGKDIQAIKLGDTASIDAFGRLRVSEPLTLFDSKQIFDNSPFFFDDAQVSGSGTTSVHSVATASTVMGVGATTAGKRVRQTFQRFNYQPGKSQLALTTFTLGAGKSGITKRTGYYDDNNGIFLQQDGSVVSIVLRTKTSGSVVDSVIPQAEWNTDRLNGEKGFYNESGFTLNITKSQIFFVDLEWLGVGRVRAGFVVDGAFIVCHEFLHANMLAGVYMSTPNLPIRYEIENDGTGAADTFEHICSSVISEGGQSDTGITRYRSTEGTHVNADVADTIYALIGIRLKSTHLGATVEPIQLSVLSETNDDFEWLLILNPTVAGTFTYADLTNSAVQTARGATENSVTGGTILGGGFGTVETAVNAGLANTKKLGASIAGTLDTLVLCVRPLTALADIEGSMTWRELL